MNNLQKVCKEVKLNYSYTLGELEAILEKSKQKLYLLTREMTKLIFHRRNEILASLNVSELYIQKQNEEVSKVQEETNESIKDEISQCEVQNSKLKIKSKSKKFKIENRNRNQQIALSNYTPKQTFKTCMKK